jgi:hypothetical protein
MGAILENKSVSAIKYKGMKEFIKQSILDNEANYSIIYHEYENEIKKLGATIFRKWLSSELNIPAEKINVNSLYAVIHRKKKKKRKSNNFSTERKTESTEKSNFKFSSIDEIPFKSGIVEI